MVLLHLTQPLYISSVSLASDESITFGVKLGSAIFILSSTRYTSLALQGYSRKHLKKGLLNIPCITAFGITRTTKKPRTCIRSTFCSSLHKIRTTSWAYSPRLSFSSDILRCMYFLYMITFICTRCSHSQLCTDTFYIFIRQNSFILGINVSQC